MTQVVYLNSSPYVATPQVADTINYLDFWNGAYITPNSTDILFTLDSKYNKRPDLLSFDYYKTSQLWWIFMLRNPDVIKDPIYDFLTGTTIYIPGPETIKGYL